MTASFLLSDVELSFDEAGMPSPSLSHTEYAARYLAKLAVAETIPLY